MRNIRLMFLFSIGVLVSDLPKEAYSGESLAELRKGQNIVDEINKGNFYAVIDKGEDGSMRLKSQYRTPAVKDALYRLLINPPPGFMSDGEGLPRIYLLRIMGDVHESKVIPVLINAMGDKGVAMSLGRMGEAGFIALRQELVKDENKIYASDAIALAEMSKKDDVGYVSDENKKKEIKKYLLRALDVSDELGKKYAVRGLGEYAIQGDSESIKCIDDIVRETSNSNKRWEHSVKVEASKVAERLKAKGMFKR